MSTDFEELQEFILADARDIYSEIVIDHAMAPRNLGVMQDANGYARVTGSCGDTMEVWLKVNADVIATATFMTDGYGPSVASDSMVTEMAQGKSIGKAQKIAWRDVPDALGGLPPDESKHCALLVTDTLEAAIRDYVAMKREPWKREYRKY